MTVPARISLVTLGVADVARATAFYLALGWPLASSSEEGVVVSFFRTGGALLGLFGASALAADAHAEPGASPQFREVTVAINVASREEVDAALAATAEAGGAIAKPAEAAEWGGYSGYFADPDGHLWEVAHNPFWPLGADGLPVLG
jgi:uncharacterized protein